MEKNEKSKKTSYNQVDSEKDEGKIVEDKMVINSLSVKKNIYKVFTICSMIIDPFFSYFLFMSISAANDYIRKELHLENKFFESFFTVLAAMVSIINQVCDFVLVNPIEEAHAITSFKDDQQIEILNIVRNAHVKRSIKVFRLFNQVTANSIYSIMATSGAISVAYLTSLKGLRWGIGIPVTVLNIIYSNMITRAKIDRHTYEFVNRFLRSNESIIINAFKTPLESFEVTLQVLASSLYRGVACGYVMNQLLIEFFRDKNSNKDPIMNGLIFYAVLGSIKQLLFCKLVTCLRPVKHQNTFY
ncbi:MAG: hypothetical protein KA508_00590 [Gammaproteobacteria bacterium]|nr:hypothetical protein [Gammaproteobacteria bacterium]